MSYSERLQFEQVSINFKFVKDFEYTVNKSLGYFNHILVTWGPFVCVAHKVQAIWTRV